MILKIGSKKVDFFNNITVNLRYDSVASDFSFDFYFNPFNQDHKAIAKPGSFLPVVVEHNGQTLITGTLLSSAFADSAVKEITTMNGYSKTGVLEDCEVPLEAYPLQSDGISLKNITEKILRPFGLKLVIDPAVSSRVAGAYKNSTGGEKQSCKEYISELAGQRHIILTHDENGNLLMTEAKSKLASIFTFESGMPGVKISTVFDAQKMHSEITVRKEADKEGDNAGESSIVNPYVTVYRPRIVKQSSGTDVGTPLAARNVLSEELQGFRITIEIMGWELNGQLVRPNQVVTVLNPHLYIYEPTKFFIESVQYKSDGQTETATLSCVLPEVYNNQTPINIFQ